MMAQHSNLYLSIKMRKTDSAELSAGYPLDSNGNLHESWKSLINNYANRIMVGTDVKYWQDSSDSLDDTLSKQIKRIEKLLDALDETTALQIRNRSALKLFGH